MLAFQQKFLSTNGELPSGTNEDDVDKFILDGMYGLSNAVEVPGDADDLQPTNDENEVPNCTTVETPPEYTTVGWYKYTIMGPCAEKEYHSHLLDVRDWLRNKRGDKESNVTNGGRTSARENTAKQ